MQYYVLCNASGAITGSGVTADGTLPAGAIECTADQFSNLSLYEVQNGAVVLVPNAAALQLSAAQAQQRALIDAAYANAVQQNVTYKTVAGTTETFEADTASQTLVMQATQGYAIAGATPAGFYWVAADNAQVPFTLADLQGLYQAILAQGWTAFQKRQTLKAQIDAATTVEAVQAIVWS